MSERTGEVWMSVGIGRSVNGKRDFTSSNQRALKKRFRRFLRDYH